MTNYLVFMSAMFLTQYMMMCSGAIFSYRTGSPTILLILYSRKLLNNLSVCLKYFNFLHTHIYWQEI